MLEQLSEDYIRTARASGLPGWYIVLCYALPNALIPSITVLGLALGDLFNTGARLPGSDGLCRRGFICLCAGQPGGGFALFVD